MRHSRFRPLPAFSMSMLDVMCCGLGAVLLLMFLNTWDARRKATDLEAERIRLSETTDRLQEIRTELKQERGLLAQARAKLKQVEAILAQTTGRLNDVQLALAATEKARQGLDAELAAKKKEADALRAFLQHAESELLARTGELSRLREEHAALLARHAGLERETHRLQQALAASEDKRRGAEAQLFALRLQWIALTAELTAKRIELADKQRLVDTLHGKVELTQKQLTEAEQLARLIPGLRQELQTLLRKLRSTELLLADANAIASMAPTLRQELDAANRLAAQTAAELALLRKQAEAAGLKLREAEQSQAVLTLEAGQLKKLLADQRLTLDLLKERLIQAETRFAGIDLGGKRVVFLIDTSGSMASVDAKTNDPTKWPEVCRTVAAILRSMPEVEKYQVILFAESIHYLLDKQGQWLDVGDRNKAADELHAALLKVVPQGGTNLYIAFEAAFRFRPQGLDTIVLISDGLPNIGPGVSQGAVMSEAARENALGKHLRDTIRARWNAGENRVRIHSVGFYYESATLGQFLWSLSRENNGSFVGMSKP